MKANRSLRNADDAVSPVIAVILMVAITVVLAATVYVWVSGFGSGTNAGPAHTMALTSAGTITSADAPATTGADDIYTKTYTVASADPTLTYGDLRITLGGALGTFDATGCAVTADAATPTQWGACGGSTDRAATAAVQAGDRFTVVCYQVDTDCLSDKDLLVLDVEANSVMITLKVR